MQEIEKCIAYITTIKIGIQQTNKQRGGLPERARRELRVLCGGASLTRKQQEEQKRKMATKLSPNPY